MSTQKTSALEIHKKQAKQLLRWHREGNYSIGERIRMLPRYRAITDQEALALKFPLSEAQEIIAVEAGYENWTALKLAAQDSPPRSKPSPTPLMLKRAIPVLYVADVNASAAFFRDRLGFAVDFLHGHPAFYGSVSRDGATLHLRFVHAPVFKEGAREQEQLITSFIVVANIKALFAEFLATGVEIGKLERAAWGGSTFSLRDLDGNTILFCEQ